MLFLHLVRIETATFRWSPFEFFFLPKAYFCYAMHHVDHHHHHIALPAGISLVSITYRYREVFEGIHYIGTELLNIGFSWWSCLCSSMWRGSLEYIAYEFVLTSPAVVVWISETKLDDFYPWGFSQYFLHLYCYFHNVSVDMSSGLLQVFVELGNLHGTSNPVLYLIHGGRLFWFLNHYRVQVLRIPVLLLACSQDWTCNLQMIVSLEA